MNILFSFSTASSTLPLSHPVWEPVVQGAMFLAKIQSVFPNELTPSFGPPPSGGVIQYISKSSWLRVNQISRELLFQLLILDAINKIFSEAFDFTPDFK